MKMYSEDTAKGVEYDPNKKFIKINLDNSNNKKFGLLSSASILTMEKHPVIDNFQLLYLDIAKCYKKFYNLVNEGKESKIDNYIRIAAFFYSNDPNELDTILGDMLDVELKRRVINKVKEMYRMNPDYSLTEETKKKYADFLYYGWKREFTEEGMQKGLKRGRKQGIKENALKMIKGMLKKRSVISRYK